MEDKELIELAAKAAGLHIKVASNSGRGLKVHGNCNWWNPITDDGDALRLAVALGIHIRLWVYACEAQCECESTGLIHASDCGGDVCAATRRAITMMATKIGKEME